MNEGERNEPAVTDTVSAAVTDTVSVTDDGFDFVRYFAERLTVPNDIFRDALIDLGNRYPPRALKAATDIYGKNGGKSARYLEGILRNLGSGPPAVSREEMREEEYRRMMGDYNAIIDI